MAAKKSHPKDYQKYSVTLSGHQTSIVVEPEFLAVLQEMAADYGINVNTLINRLDMEADRAANLSRHLRLSALRYCLNKIRKQS